jgi:circadian clock protein KaiB
MRSKGDERGESISSPSVLLRLYVSKEAEKHAKEADHLRAILTKKNISCVVELIDVMKEPLAAEKDNVLATPTLMKIRPAPVKKVIGDLANGELALGALGLIDPQKE